MSYTEYSGNLPGTTSEILFKKSEDGYEGHLKLHGESLSFSNKNQYYLVACITSCLGATEEKISDEARNLDVANLGKSIDLLVKARTLKDIRKSASDKSKLKKGDSHGPPAKQKAPEPPKMPQATAAPTPAEKVHKPPMPAMAKPKLPKLQSLRLSEKEIGTCRVCEGEQVRGGQLLGCVCFSDLIKNTSIEKTGDVYAIKLNAEWDLDTIETFLESVKR